MTHTMLGDGAKKMGEVGKDLMPRTRGMTLSRTEETGVTQTSTNRVCG